MTLVSTGYNFHTLFEWMENSFDSGAVIRHDVDRRAGNALKTAEMEKNLGIKATYYFRIVNCSFKESIISEIAGMGHEIGYHYEELTAHKGDYEKAAENFGINLGKIRKFYDVKTIAMHGKPVSRLDNRKLWDRYDFGDYGIKGDAYLSIDYSDIYYFSDTGRSWKTRNAKNYKDYVNGLEAIGVENSRDLVEFIKIKRPEKIFVMTHPERWNDNAFDYSMYWMREFFIGNIKRLYYFVR